MTRGCRVVDGIGSDCKGGGLGCVASWAQAAQCGLCERPANALGSFEHVWRGIMSLEDIVGVISTTLALSIFLAKNEA